MQNHEHIHDSNIKRLTHTEIQEVKKIKNVNELDSINFKLEDHLCYLVQEGLINAGIYSIRKDKVENLTSSFENKYSGVGSLKSIINNIDNKNNLCSDLTQKNMLFEQLKESNKRLELEKKNFAEKFHEYVKILDDNERDLENLIKTFEDLEYSCETLKDIKILKDIGAQFDLKEQVSSASLIINQDQSSYISVQSENLSKSFSGDNIDLNQSIECLKCSSPTKNSLEGCNHFMCIDCIESPLMTRKCGHQSCNECINSMSICKKCTEVSIIKKKPICTNCRSEKKFIKIKRCSHKNCETCFKIYKECSVCYKSQGLCKFCLNKKENIKLQCGHLSCEDCNKNDLCFSCLLSTNPKNIRYVESIKCEVCLTNTNNYIMAKCNHYLCQKCFIKTKNLDFKCYPCSIKNLLETNCTLCGNNTKYSLENHNSIKVLCCDTFICKICFEFIEGVCKKCNVSKRASSSHKF